MEKAVAILFICIILAGLAISGCASRDRGIPTATPVSTATPSAYASPPASPTIVPNTSAASSTGIDPSLANISGEDDASLPELNIPTPSAE